MSRTQNRMDIAAVCAALNSPRMTFAEAVASVRPVPGLYALWASASVWETLGLGPPDDRPLYVGKSEDSLRGRPLGDHFQHSRIKRSSTRESSLTGWSSPRRSLAALLRDQLGLRAIPRDTRKPGCFDRYGLSTEQDERLTHWMRENLQISFWPSDGIHDLEQVEDAVVDAWRPPLNLDIHTPWKAQIERLRHDMADEAEAWSPASLPSIRAKGT